MGICCSAITKREIIIDTIVNTNHVSAYGSEVSAEVNAKQSSNELIECLARECAVSPDTASQALQHNDNISDAIVHVLDNHHHNHHNLLPPLAALAIQHGNSISLCSRQTAIALINHRVCGDFGTADHLLHEMFATAKHSTLSPVKPPYTTTRVPSEAFECAVCYGQIAPQEGTRLANCSHQFCTSCLSEHIKNSVCAPESILNVRCVDADCTQLITEREVRLLCPHETLEVGILAAIDDLVATDHCLRRCPTVGCNYVFHFCPVRMQSACTVCPDCHQKSIKPTVEQLVVEERALQKIMNQYNVRMCARCGTGLEKLSGCNKMKCRCGYRFCYVCGIENAQCGHTPSSHGFINNLTGSAEFRNLRDTISPDAQVNAKAFEHTGRPRCKKNHHLQLNKKGWGSKKCNRCRKHTNAYYSCAAKCQFRVCAECYHK